MKLDVADCDIQFKLAGVRAFFMEILASMGKSLYLCTQKMKNVQVATCRIDIVVNPTAFLSESK